ncbi:hypothetical protein [Marinisporobacter balticus]|uniref:Uncharacterized protein n=1 Tax=Marinisporobacter balticus TaxID=2018667 RepID=A0A4R2KLV8_9FIRM|nr:hypothetical protein [Marinisporobacter balticus]TCO74404.1 hypothetical protein EV214_11349 [Marinisporobacter balticus]
MIDKAALKKIHNVIQWMVAIVMIGIGIHYFFISKTTFKEIQWLIMWSGVGIMNVGRLIDARYFEDNFNWKKHWKNAVYVFVSVVIVVGEIKKIWL